MIKSRVYISRSTTISPGYVFETASRINDQKINPTTWTSLAPRGKTRYLYTYCSHQIFVGCRQFSCKSQLQYDNLNPRAPK